MQLDKKVLGLWAAAFAGWIIGFVVKSVVAPDLAPAFATNVSLLVLTISVFTFSFFFFGFPSAIVMFFAGNYSSAVMQRAADAYFFVGVAGSFAAAFSAVFLGSALLDDLVGKGNFKKTLRISLLVFIAGAALAGLADLTVMPRT